MPGTLFIVATPIGNLEDITLRALRILREADVIAAEDTRHSAILLRHYDIRTPTTSFHEHNEQAKTPLLIRRLLAGERVALVSDAGTPGISDPGFRLARAAHAAGVRVEPIPGPSAVIAALVASGLPTDAFKFVGFPPNRSKARKLWLQDIASSTVTTVFFESPHQITVTLRDLAALVGPGRGVSVARELTKTHEQLVNRPINEILSVLGSSPRGEFTVVVSPSEEKAVGTVLNAETIAHYFGYLTKETGVSRRDGIRETARKYGLSSNAVYRAIEASKNSGK